jgi:hypothetical protein
MCVGECGIHGYFRKYRVVTCPVIMQREGRPFLVRNSQKYIVQRRVESCVRIRKECKHGFLNQGGAVRGISLGCEEAGAGGMDPGPGYESKYFLQNQEGVLSAKP